MNENNYVVKANQFIQAKGRLGALEQKLLAALISEIQPDDEDFKRYNLKIQEVGEFIGLNNNAVYERLRETAINLKNKSLSLEEINPTTKKKTFIEVNLISSARHTEGSGVLTITIAPDLKPYLLAIKGDRIPFTKYMIKNILKLNSSYSIRFYELLKQYEKIKKRDFDIDELKDLLGIEAESYNIFSEFERRVLKVAKGEINEKTDIWIDYKKIKKGRKITRLSFEIKSKFIEADKLKEMMGENEIEVIKTKCGLIDEKFSDKQIMDIYEKAIERVGDEDIDLFEYIRLNYLQTKDKARNKYAYLLKAVENDYASAIGQIKFDYYL